jgi:hypothetical protein
MFLKFAFFWGNYWVSVTIRRGPAHQIRNNTVCNVASSISLVKTDNSCNLRKGLQLSGKHHGII